MTPTKAQRRALRWLADNGGHASLDRYGRACVGDSRDSALPATWLRLIIAGHVARSPVPGRFGITVSGVDALK